MPCTDTSIRLTVSHVDGRHLRPGRRVTDFEEEVLVSAVGMLGLVLSVPRKIPGCTGEGNWHDAEPDAPVAGGMGLSASRRQGPLRRRR